MASYKPEEQRDGTAPPSWSRRTARYYLAEVKEVPILSVVVISVIAIEVNPKVYFNIASHSGTQGHIQALAGDQIRLRKPTVEFHIKSRQQCNVLPAEQT